MMNSASREVRTSVQTVCGNGKKSSWTVEKKFSADDHDSCHAIPSASGELVSHILILRVFDVGIAR